MITLAGVKDWLKTISSASHYYIGALDDKHAKSIGVYSRQRAGAPIMAMGDAGSYDVKAITVLVHWTNNADETERTTLSLWEELKSTKDLIINETQVNFILLNVPEPVAVGADSNGIYEYVIEIDLYYRKDR